MPASLHVIEGPDRGRLFTLSGTTVTIGRSADNTIVLNDVAVSGVHSKIVRTESGQYTLHDNASTNGTFVNGREARVVDLKHGDTVRIGGSVMAFELQRQGGILPGEGGDRGAVRPDQEVVPYREPTLIDVASLSREQLERLVRRGGILEQLDQALAELDAPTEILAAVLDAALAAAGAQRGFILLVDERTGEIVPSVVRNLTGDTGEIPFSKGLAFEVVAQRKGFARDDVDGPVLGAPIVAYGRSVGVIHLDAPREGRFDPDAPTVLESIGLRTGPAVAAARSRVDFEVLFSSMIDAMMKSIQAKDVYTRGHSERVRHYSRILGKEVGLSGQDLYRLTLGAAVHDIGKIGMPDSVLKFNTNPRLTPEQMDEVKKHPVRGAKILGEIPFLRDVVAAAELHHEDWDGGGYPHGMKGDEVPLIARIVAVADTYDAITTDRPYQKGAPYEKGHEILRKIAGKRLDPELVEAFVSAWHRYRKGPSQKQAAAAPVESHETCKIDKETQQAAREAAARPELAAEPLTPPPSPSDGADDDGGELGDTLREIILIG
ncbi:MAG: FHA domain-containing protein [Planctomycetota bacterium]|nr:FHA domain-containing protein [Planctomycetota bacterium]